MMEILHWPFLVFSVVAIFNCIILPSCTVRTDMIPNRRLESPLQDKCVHPNRWRMGEGNVWGSDARTELVASRDDGIFRIIQFTDLHFDEEPSTDWGPEQDVNTTRVMNNIMDEEESDLIMITGDVISVWRDNATAYWDIAMDPIIQRNRKYAVTFGNHDDCDKPYTIPPPDDLTRRRILLEYDMMQPGSITSSFFQSSEFGGITNYYIKLYRSEEERQQDDIAAILWVLDSGGGSVWDIVRQDQVEWFVSAAEALKRRYQKSFIPSLLFMHIPTPEYATINPQAGVEGCTGIHRDGINPTKRNTNVADMALRMGVSHIIVGHNHGNTFCCPMTEAKPSTQLHEEEQSSTEDEYVTLEDVDTPPASIQLCYSGHSGYGGYGDWDRGARIFELDLNALKQQQVSFDQAREVETESESSMPSSSSSSALRKERPEGRYDDGGVSFYFRMEDGTIVEQE